MNIFQKLKRKIIYWYQRRTRGFDNRELWSLDYTIASFVLPRLKVFRNYTHGYPSRFENMEQWQKTIDEMIFAMEFTIKEGEGKFNSETYQEEYKRYRRGMKLFCKYFHGLWD